MSAWRSPLLYFGIAIIVLVAAALVAPHLVDWNRYRPQIAAWGTRLTGREVTIRGDVSVTLFPWPTLVLRGVSVANPPGARQPALLEAEAITARLSLAALVSGRLEVEKVDFRRPVVSLERLADGTGTWRLRPAARVHLPFTPERIAIAGITIEDGTVLLVDARRGGEARLTAIDAHISAPRLIGPWKLRADAELQGVPVNILITTGRITAGGPVRVSARLAPREGGGFVYAFDGTLRDPRPGRLRGRLRIRPQPAKGKENMAEGLALYTFRADVLADFDEVWLKNLEAAPLAATRSANTVKGEAHILLGGILEAEATLKAGRFDLDWLLGDDARRLFGVRGLRAVADLAAALPPDVLLRLDLSASSLTAGGETLQGVHLSLDASAEQLAVNAFSTTLPGGSRLAFTGQLLPAETPQLSGAVEFESRALRDFVLWAAPARADAVSRLWTGARGRLVLDARLDATAERLRLFDGNFRLDDAGGRVELFLAPARLRANVRADALNVDRYAPSGLAAGGDGAAPARALLEIIAAAMGFGDVDVDLAAGRMHLWGLPMRGVNIALRVDADHAEIRRFDIASLKGARIAARGRLTFPEDGIAGSLESTVTAADVTPLWALLSGHRGKGGEMPTWLRGLGGLDLAFSADARSLSPGAAVRMRLKGTAGPLKIDADGRFSGRVSRWREARVDLGARLDSPRSRPLLALLLGTALPAAGADRATGRAELPASLELSARGTPRDGLRSELRLALAGLDVAWMGELRNASAEAGTTGRGRLALRTARLPRVLSLLGFGRDPRLPGTMWAEGDLSFSPRAARWRDLRGRLGEAELGGELTLTAPEPEAAAGLEPGRALWRLSGRVSGDRLDLPMLTRIWLTTGETTEAPLRTAIFAGPALSLELTGDTLTALPGLSLRGGRVEITGEPHRSVHLRIRAGHPPADADGKKTTAADAGADGLRADIRLRPARTGLLAEGEVTALLDPAPLLRRRDGPPLIESRLWLRATARAAGRSLAALTRALSGRGRLRLAAGRLPAMDVGAFLKAAARLTESGRLDETLRATLKGAALPFPGAGSELRIDAGVLAVAPVEWKAAGFAIRAEALAEAAGGRLDISFRFTPGPPYRPRGQQPPPPFTLAFVGPPGALELTPQIDELRDWVSVTALARSMSELERVERERRRILEEESAFERRQVMFERWRAWAEERARREAAFRARVERLLKRRERDVRRQMRRLRRQLREERRARRREAAARAARALATSPAPAEARAPGAADGAPPPSVTPRHADAAAGPPTATRPEDGKAAKTEETATVPAPPAPVTPPLTTRISSPPAAAPPQPPPSMSATTAAPARPPRPQRRPAVIAAPEADAAGREAGGTGAPIRIAPVPPPKPATRPGDRPRDREPGRPPRPRVITNFGSSR